MAFAEIVGQPKAVKLLNRSLQSGRLAHAYLFSGPDGVGKNTTAKAMTALLLCANDSAVEPCGFCPGCQKFASGNHPDFLHIKPQGAAIKIDQIRELKKALSFPPLEAEYRVTLLEDVHTMRREAGNSLLKLLEEPPPDNVLLLSADESEQLLTTIVSRCQVIPFYPISREQTADIVMKLSPNLSRPDALTLAVLADGCPGNALSFEADDVLEIRKAIINALLKPQSNEADETETAFVLAARAAELKNSLGMLISLLRLFFKEAMLVHCNPSHLNGGDPELDEEVKRARERWNLTQLSDMVDAVNYAEQALARNCSQALVCEVLFFNLIH